jgi:hypothetical protein
VQYLFRKVRGRVMADADCTPEPFLYGSPGSELFNFAG